MASSTKVTQSNHESETRIYSLCVHNLEIYGGSYYGGFLFKWNGTDSWETVANTSEWSTGGYQYWIQSICSHNGSLFCGYTWRRLTSTYYYSRLLRLSGSTLESVAISTQVEGSPDQNLSRIYNLFSLNGFLYGLLANSSSGSDNIGYLSKWNGVDAWTHVSQELSGAINGKPYSYCIRNGQVYVGTITGKLYVWNGVDTLTLLAAIPTLNILVLCLHNNLIYAVNYSTGALFVYDEVSSFTELVAGVTGVYCTGLVSSPNGLFALGYSGIIRRWNDGSAWETYVTNAEASDHWSFVSHNNLLYTGNDLAALYETDIPMASESPVVPVQLSGVPTRGKAPLSVRFTPTTALGQ
jgi:hypothetical protein